MIIANSVKQVLRTPVRTGLFTILLLAVTTFLCIGCYMWTSVSQSLDQVEAGFTTVGIIEHDSHVSPRIDLSPITNSQYVELSDRRQLHSVYGVGLTLSTPPPRPHGNAIVIFEPLETAVQGEPVPIRVLEILSPTSIRTDRDYRVNSEILLEPGKLYITAGSPDSRGEFQVGLLSFDPIAEIPQGNLEVFFKSDEGRLWAELLETFTRSVDSLTAVTSRDINTIYAFHQGNAILTSGRSFTQEEYDQGARVALVSVNMANHNGLELGDKIDLSFYRASIINSGTEIAVTAQMSGFDFLIGEGEYEIIGLYTIPILRGGEWYKISNDTIFVPQSSSNSAQFRMANNLLSVRLTNGKAEDFLAEMKDANIDGISIRIYDQGYSKVSGALAGMKETALILMAICLGAGLVLVTLFAFLYVGRQKRSIAIMFSLGVSRRKTLEFITATVCCVAVLATSLGGIAGYILSDTILTSVYQRMTDKNALDTSFSAIAAGAEVQYQVSMPGGITVPLLAMATMLVMTLALSAVFSAKVLRTEPMQVLTAKEE